MSSAPSPGTAPSPRRADPAPSPGSVPRAGIVVTGTEVLTGRIADANGPWLAERLRELGVDVGRIVVVGDRRADLAACLDFLLADHDLVITSGGLGPTADDLTAEVVAQVQGRALRLDPDLSRRVLAIIEDKLALSGDRPASLELFRDGADKQGTVPDQAHVLDPVGTAPGFVVPSAHGRAPVVVLPGPPRELRPMWGQAVQDPWVRAVLGVGQEIRQATVRLWGPSESELADVLRQHEAAYGALDRAGLEVTTCLREGELEVVTRYSPAAQPDYQRFADSLRSHFRESIYSLDGATVDDVVATLLRTAGLSLATAESCTGGLLAARILDVAGASEYFRGGFVAYANAAKVGELGVPQTLLDSVGAVSPEVARAMADGARQRLGTDLGIGITGIAGPGGGTPDKPVGLVEVALLTPTGDVARTLRLSGSRQAIRQRTVSACLHLLRQALSGNESTVRGG